jgi:hypothetical protein
MLGHMFRQIQFAILYSVLLQKKEERRNNLSSVFMGILFRSEVCVVSSNVLQYAVALSKLSACS